MTKGQPPLPQHCFVSSPRHSSSSSSSGQASPETDEEKVIKELEPLRLPGKLAGFTGNVMYPDGESSVWDVNGRRGTELTSYPGLPPRLYLAAVDFSPWLRDKVWAGGLGCRHYFSLFK